MVAEVAHPEAKVRDKLDGTVMTTNPPRGIGFVFLNLRE